MRMTRTLVFAFLILNFTLAGSFCFAQDEILEANIDFAASTIPLPKIFSPNIDLSGRGASRINTWPQSLSAEEAIEAWGKDIGFKGIYRLQYDLWEIYQLSKDKEAQEKLLANYDKIIKNVSNAGGIVLLDLYGTPAGLGKVLDKNSPPWDLKAFKELIKQHMRTLSCVKKYNVWYEVWSAPDLDDFFLGDKQEYFNLYRAVAQCARELEMENKIHIPVGGPSTSCWFQNTDGNTVMTPERSLIYEFIKFCYRYRLPLDFISWHSYSTSPNRDQDTTTYKKNPVNLIRDWLTYFNFDKATPLIVDEWNYDSGINLDPERGSASYIAASYIPSRLKNMFDIGINHQVYFCLEDFNNEKEGVIRNVGAFGFDWETAEYKGAPKPIYNVFRMIHSLGENMLPAPLKAGDGFLEVIATKSQESLILLVYNYIDPDIAKNFISKNVTSLNDGERKILLNFIKSGGLVKIKDVNAPVLNVRNKKVEKLLNKARQLDSQALKLKDSPRVLGLNIKNLKGNYLYQKYSVDSSCSSNCNFAPSDEKEVEITDIYKEVLFVKPYSVTLIILKSKPKTEPVAQVPTAGAFVQESVVAGQ